MTNNQEMDHTTPFAVSSETNPQPQPQPVAAAAGELSRQERERQKGERNRLEKAWYKAWMAMKGREYPLFLPLLSFDNMLRVVDTLAKIHVASFTKRKGLRIPSHTYLTYAHSKLQDANSIFQQQHQPQKKNCPSPRGARKIQYCI